MFADRDRGIFNGGEFAGELGHFVVMRGEECAALVHLVQVFERGPGDGQAVVGGGAAADFVKDHQRTVVRLVQDRGGFDHFDHKGRAATG